MSTQTIDFNNVDSVSFNGEFIDILNLNGTQIWERARWFTYTGIDASGNYEGTTAYDGTPIEYGIGKPTLTTADDGTVTVKSWAYANGLSDDYFTEKYGDEYVRYWGDLEDSTIPEPIQCVEDTLVIPTSHNGLPVTRILESAFYSRQLATTGAYIDKRYQPYFYTNVVFGANITTLDDDALANMKANMPKITLPDTITALTDGSFGSTYKIVSQVEVNSNITSASAWNYVPTVIFNSGVTEIVDPIDRSTTYADQVFVFKHAADAELTITYSSTPKIAQTLTIYTDNEYVKNYDWATNGNITPTFYSLSEWTEA